MGKTTGIDWTDHTFNAWEGCEKVSPACKNCYADSRDQWIHSGKHWGPNTPRLMHKDAYWQQPLKWNAEAEARGKFATVFANSLGDVFEDHDDLIEPRDRLFDLIESTPYLFWLLLTKRPENIPSMLPMSWDKCVSGMPKNVGLGTTAETQEYADKRIPELLKVPAALHFVSVEPMLGPVDLRCLQHNREFELDALTGDHGVLRPLRGKSDRKLEWVIVGGESGKAARSSHTDWFRGLRDQCKSAGVPFFFKQWGEWAPSVAYTYRPKDHAGQLIEMVGSKGETTWHAHPPDANNDAGKIDVLRRVGKKAAGRMLDGRLHDEFPEVVR